MTPEPLSLTVITVAFHSAAVLPAMLLSLPPEARVIVVDNGPNDGMRDHARAMGAQVIVPGENLGFGCACNLAAAEASSDLLLFLNPDAELAPDAWPALCKAAGRHPKAAAFGPCFVQGSGKRSYKRRSRLTPHIAALPKSIPEEETVVPMLSGAALLVRRHAFETVGGFDPDLFLYYEDDDLTLRLSATQGPLWFVPAARVLHNGGRSSPPSAKLSRQKGYHWARAFVIAGRKHGLRRPMLTALRNALSHAVSPKVFTSAERRATAFGRIEGVLSLWRA